jgi:exoribonuclease R
MHLQTKNYRDFQIIDDVTVKTFIGASFASKALCGDTVIPTEDGCELVCRREHPPIAGLLELSSKVRYGMTAKNYPIYLFTPFNEAYPPFIVGCSDKNISKNRLALVTFDSWTGNLPRGVLQRFLDSEEEALSWTYTPLACQRYKGEMPAPPSFDDRRSIQAFHIDPVGCRDVDDVLTFEEVNGETFVIITISDVAAHIPKGHPIDVRASQIAQTFYQDGAARPVFPAALSEDRMSLLPGEYKAGVSLRFCLEDPTRIEWFESRVQTVTYTYESIYKAKDLCKNLRRMATILGQPTEDSHEWIEVAMKFYNIEAAKMLRKARTGLLRCHKEGAMTQLPLLAYASAEYVPADHPAPFHYGLNAELYTHATSPIRRYADLINQRAIKAILAGEPVPPLEPVAHLNHVSKQAKRHDRDLIFMKAIREGPKVVEGVVIGEKVYVPEWQTRVKIAGPLVEGETLKLEYYADMSARNWKRRMIVKRAD